MVYVRVIVALVVFFALVALSFQNSEKVTLKFFNIAQWDPPLAVIVLVAFASGVAAGLLAGAVRATRLKRQLTKLRREQRSGSGPLPMPSGAIPGTTPASGPGFTRRDL